MAGLGIVNVVPQQRGMIALRSVPNLRVGIFAIGLALGLHRFVISGNSNGTRDKGPVIAAGVVKTHAQTLLADGGGQLANDVARGMLPVGRQLGVGRRTGPERKSLVMFVVSTTYFAPASWKILAQAPGFHFLNLSVEDRSEVVVIVVSAVVLAMVSLCRRSLDPHAFKYHSA